MQNKITPKHTKDMSRAELETAELFELLGDIKEELRKIKAIADEALIKASVSHSLIVVRKVAESNVDKLNNILD